MRGKVFTKRKHFITCARCLMTQPALGAKRAKRYHSRVDRLDTWLNSQRGWRHLLVAWLMALPGGIALSEMWVLMSSMFGPTALGVSAVLERMALGFVASVPLAVLVFSIESRSRRRPSKRGKNRMPRYRWRGMVAISLLIAANACITLTTSESVQWRRQQSPFFFVAPVGLDVIAMAFMIWNLQYWHRLRRTIEVARNHPGSLSGVIAEDMRGKSLRWDTEAVTWRVGIPED
jgi:hypothetical protein